MSCLACSPCIILEQRDEGWQGLLCWVPSTQRLPGTLPAASCLRGTCASLHVALPHCGVSRMDIKVRQWVFPTLFSSSSEGYSYEGRREEKVAGCSVQTRGAIVCVAVWLWWTLPVSCASGYLLHLYTPLYHSCIIGPQPELSEILTLISCASLCDRAFLMKNDCWHWNN